jgi:signal transduction histidine kinase
VDDREQGNDTTMARILLLLQQQANRRLLSEWLAPHHQVVTADAVPDNQDAFDLAIVDSPSLERLRQGVQARKEAEAPIFLPFVLLTPRQQVSLAARHLGRTVDEVLLLPTDKIELRARVELLLLVRQQSQDLWQYRQDETALRAAHRALDDAKTTFMHLASQTLQPPLVAIQDEVDGLLTGAGLAQEAQQSLQHIRSHTEQLLRLVSELLEATRLLSGLQQPSLQAVELGALLQEVSQHLQPLAESKRLQTVVAVPPPPVQVQADRHGLTQVLTALLTNAYLYAPDETSVILRVSLQAQSVQIDVVDQGPGIAEPDQQYLLTPFGRSVPAQGQESSDPGLRLFLAQVWVEKHGGRIWVTSRPGEDNTFSCTFLLAPSEA